MLDLDALQAAALARLKHSIATSAGMHKRQVRLRAERLRLASDAALRQPLFIKIAKPQRYLQVRPYVSPDPAWRILEELGLVRRVEAD